METNQELQALLASIGLKEVMVEKDSIDPFDSGLFIIYTPEEYLKSERKEMDEIYRIGEKVLIHKTSGLRIEYVTTESYYGDEYTYRLKRHFYYKQYNAKNYK
jgi:hypothetical protein